MADPNDHDPTSRPQRDGSIPPPADAAYDRYYTQGPETTAPSCRDRPIPLPVPSFTTAPIPYPSPRSPDGSLPSLPGSQHTFFPNFHRHDKSPLINVASLNNTNGAFPHPSGLDRASGSQRGKDEAGVQHGAEVPQQQPALALIPSNEVAVASTQQVPRPRFGNFQAFARSPAASIPSATTVDFSRVALSSEAPLNDPFHPGTGTGTATDPNGSHASQLSQHSRQSSIATQGALQQAFAAARQPRSSGQRQSVQGSVISSAVPMAIGGLFHS